MHIQKNTWMILEQTRKKGEKMVIKIRKRTKSTDSFQCLMTTH